MANLVTLQGEHQPFVRNVMTLKSCSPIVGVDVMSFDTEREVLLAWRVIILAKVMLCLNKLLKTFLFISRKDISFTSCTMLLGKSCRTSLDFYIARESIPTFIFTLQVLFTGFYP